MFAIGVLGSRGVDDGVVRAKEAEEQKHAQGNDDRDAEGCQHGVGVKFGLKWLRDEVEELVSSAASTATTPITTAGGVTASISSTINAVVARSGRRILLLSPKEVEGNVEGVHCGQYE